MAIAFGVIDGQPPCCLFVLFVVGFLHTHLENSLALSPLVLSPLLCASLFWLCSFPHVFVCWWGHHGMDFHVLCTCFPFGVSLSGWFHFCVFSSVLVTIFPGFPQEIFCPLKFFCPVQSSGDWNFFIEGI
jgi:hypothetical protein